MSQAIADALPAIISERDATDGVPSGTSSLSPSISFTSLDIDAELPRDDARQRREMPLPHRLHAEPDRDLAVLEAQVRLLVQDAARDFEEAAHPDAAQLAVLRDAARRLAKPFQSASASALSIAASNSPLS